MDPSVDIFKICLADNKFKSIAYNGEQILSQVLQRLCNNRDWKLEDYYAYKDLYADKIVDLNIPLKSLGTKEIFFLPRIKITPEVEKFHLAVSEGNLNLVSEYLRTMTIDINGPGKVKQRTALHTACAEGKKQMARLLIKNGAQLMVLDELRWTPLHCAAVGGHLDIAEYLIKKGHDVNIATTDGTTCLHYLVRRDWSPKLEKTIDLVIKSGANINAKNKNDDTALHTAVERNKVEACLHLLRSGASLLFKNKSGQTPLEMATAQNKLEISKVIDDWLAIESSTSLDDESKGASSPSKTKLDPHHIPTISVSPWGEGGVGWDSEEDGDDEDTLENPTQKGERVMEEIAKKMISAEFSGIINHLHKENALMWNDVNNISTQLQKIENELKKLKKKAIPQ